MDDVSFDVPPGSFFSILGPSGCGKTTIMRMIAGFLEPTRGDINIKGKSVLDVPPNKRPVNMVFQHLALFPMMNIADNIGYGLRRAGLNKSEIAPKVEDALERIGLPGIGARKIDQLSGGQKQRVAIARCMVLEPDVLLLDEPLGALDLKLRERMKVELKTMQEAFDTTFVYITHDQSEALVMSDQIAVSRQFFSTSYLTHQTQADLELGDAVEQTYDQGLHLAEAWAQAQQTLDLDANAHFDMAGVMGDQILDMAALICWLTLSLFMLTLAEALHPTRWMMRYGAAALGLVSLGIGVLGVWNAA